MIFPENHNHKLYVGIGQVIGYPKKMMVNTFNTKPILKTVVPRGLNFDPTPPYQPIFIVHPTSRRPFHRSSDSIGILMHFDAAYSWRKS